LYWGEVRDCPHARHSRFQLTPQQTHYRAQELISQVGGAFVKIYFRKEKKYEGERKAEQEIAEGTPR